MLSYFKSQQPTTIVAFIVFFIVLKIPFSFNGGFFPLAEVDNLWSSSGMLLHQSFFVNFLAAQLCLFVQAITFNFLFHRASYHEGSGMIPAIYFVLITSLIPGFNEFSIYIILGFILMWMFQVLLIITIKDSSKFECFNLGFIGGLLVVLDSHFVLFTPFLFCILYVIKPFRFNEYLMLAFGILCPVYLALGISYLADIPIDLTAYSISNFRFFRFQKDVFNIILVTLTLCYLLFSFISLRGIKFSTGFKRRKNINMLVFFFVGITAVVLLSGNHDEAVFSLLFIPMSIFLSLFMLRIRKKKLGEILNGIFVVTVLIVNIIRMLR